MGQRGGDQGVGRENGLSRPQPDRQVAPILPSPGTAEVGSSIGPPDSLRDDSQLENKEEDVEAEVCFICASTVIHNSIAPCNHRTCHICALRLRALYKTRACAHCRTEAKFVIFTDDATKRYENFEEPDFQHTDDVLGIKYEHKEIHDDTVLLLRYNCPADDCDVACWGWPDLHRHVKGAHHKVLCDLCTRNKKVFTHEHELFTPQELRRHEKFGDDHPGAVDQSGFKGHPQCGFCVQRFYSDDELYAHCRDRHERCHICDRRDQGRQQQYYRDYNSLEEHFRTDHFLCADQECLDKKFVVFESEMDLKAHQLETHPNGLTKDARRDARRVDISGFDYRPPHQDGRGGRRDRESRGRGRDPNIEALPVSTAQPMRRDEIAYQRQMALQNTQPNVSRSTDAYAARPIGRSQETVTAPRPSSSSNDLTPPLDNLSLNSIPPGPSSLTPQEQARHLQHAAVLERASKMMENDSSKMTDFRTSVSSFRTSKITPQQLIETIFTLIDAPSSDLGKLIKELAELYDNESKRTDLLKAWSDWRAINEDYPSLPGPNGVLPGASGAAAGSGGKRVLRLKSSTAQSSRSAVSKQGSWGQGLERSGPVSAASSSSTRGAISTASSSFPAISAAASRNSSTTPWVNSNSTAGSRGSASVRPPAASPNPRTAGGVQGAEAFPALPTAAKPNTLMAGLSRGSVRWDDSRSGASNSSANPWVGGSSTSNSASVNIASGSLLVPDGDEDVAAAGGKRKGNKNKKQTLYKFG